MGKKILVTGAAGFIGSQLAYRLYKSGEDITLLDNFSYGQPDNLMFEDVDFNDTILHMDIRDRDGIEALFRDNHFDVVYHIAGITPLPDCQMDPAEAVDVNVEGTVVILEAARRYGAGHVIFASTSAVYEKNTDFPSREDHVEPPELIYPVTKYTAESFCRAYVGVYGMNITVLRFANVYGPHIDCLRKQPPVLGYLIREFYYDRKPVLHSTGEQLRDFVYVDDLIELAIRVQDGTGYDTVNVSTGEVHSINEMCAITASIMGKEHLTPEYTDSDNFWKNYPGLYEGAYTISKEALRGEVEKYTCLSNEHARTVYGWEPKTNFEAGIRATVEFSVKAIERRTQ